MPDKFFSTTGLANNSGSQQAPTTITRHNDPQGNLSITPGSVLRFKCGDVFESALLPQFDGDDDHPITYGSYGAGPAPLFVGLRTLTGWRSEGNGIYSVPLAVYYLHMTIQLDNVVVYAGKWPREQDWAPYQAGGQGYLNGDGVSQIPFPINKNNAFVSSRKNRYIIDRNRIQSVVGANLQYYGDYNYGNSLQYGNDPNGGFYISNHPGTLLGLGDWYYDYNPENLGDTANNRLYMHFGGGTPDQHVVKASVDFYNLDVTGRRSITFDGLAFEGANISGIRVGTNTNNSNDQSTWIRSQDIRLLNLTVINQGGNAIAVNGDSILISSNTVIKADNNGIDASDCTDLTIQGNDVQNCGMVAGEGRSADLSYIAICVNHSDNPLIQHNIITNTGYDAISVTGKYRSVIKWNFINGTCFKKDDGGGIYLVDPNNEGANAVKLIQGNTVLNTRGDYQFVYTGGENQEKGYGIYGDNKMSGMKILENILINHNQGSGGVLINGGKNCQVEGNKVMGFYQAQLMLNKRNFPNGEVADISGNLIKNNTFVSNAASQRMVYCYGNATDNPRDWADFQDNTYASPLNRAQAFTITGQADRSFQAWKALTGKETGSREEEITTSASGNVVGLYNATSEPQLAIVDPGPGKHVGANMIRKTVTLAPYTAEFFIMVGTRLVENNAGELQTDADGRLVSEMTPV